MVGHWHPAIDNGLTVSQIYCGLISGTISMFRLKNIWSPRWQIEEYTSACWKNIASALADIKSEYQVNFTSLNIYGS